MTNSNSNNMTLEDKIVQTIKDTHLFALIQDEDAIAKLVHRAIEEALFKPRPDKVDAYGRVLETFETPIVVAAREVAQKGVDKIAADILSNILENDDVRKTIFKAMVNLLPGALNALLQKQIQATIQNETIEVNNALVIDIMQLENQLINKGIFDKYVENKQAVIK